MTDLSESTATDENTSLSSLHHEKPLHALVADLTIENPTNPGTVNQESPCPLEGNGAIFDADHISLRPSVGQATGSATNLNTLDAILELGRKLYLNLPTDESELMMISCYGELCKRRLGDCWEGIDNQMLKMGEKLLMASRDISQPQIFDALAHLFLHRYQHSADIQDITSEVACRGRAAFLTQNREAQRPGRLWNLGSSFDRRFQRTAELSDLEQAISCYEQALLLANKDHIVSPLQLLHIGSLLLFRYEILGKLSDIQEAIVQLTRAFSSTSDDHPLMPKIVNNLGISFMRRYENLGQVEDIEEAIFIQRLLVSLRDGSDQDSADQQQNLGLSLTRRFEHLGELGDLEEAIACQNQVLRLTVEGHKDIPQILNNLGYSYLRRFERLDEVSDLEIALRHLDQAVQLSPSGNSNRPECLNSFSNCLMSRFERFGELIDIDRAVASQSEAVLLTAKEHRERPGRVNNLANRLSLRYHSLFQIEDVDRAISCLEEALRMTPDEHTDKPQRLNNLGNALLARFRELHKLADVDQAVGCYGQAVSLTSETHVERHVRLRNFGNSLGYRFDLLHQIKDIDQTISSCTEALSLTTEGHADRCLSLHALGLGFFHRFEHLKNPSDLDQAISLLDQAVLATSEPSAILPGLLVSLGISILSRVEKNRDPADRTRAISLFKQAAQSPLGNPHVRFRAALLWAEMSATQNKSSSLEAYQHLMDLVPRMVRLGATIRHRYQDITYMTDAIMKAGTVAMECHEYDTAVEWLEEGRSIVWKQMLQLRHPLEDLRQVNPALADRLGQVSRELEHSSMGPEPYNIQNTAESLEQVAQKSRRDAEEWDRLVASARQIPNFNYFLRPKKADELVTAAQSGPVVFINVQKASSDALVLPPNSDTGIHIPLPYFPYAMAVKLRAQMTNVLTELGSRGVVNRGPVFESTQTDDAFEGILAILWSNLVEPILKALKYLTPEPANPLPRVTWCTTGPLASLPLHAAGLYETADSRSKAFNYVVSSYTPTLGALLVPSPTPDTFRGILTVGQAKTVGQPALPYTVKELEHIASQAGDLRLTELTGDRATSAAVLDAMEDHSWVHLACHAKQNASDPTTSGFYLHDGKLDLTAITKKSLKSAGLAFLSACQTASGDETLPEEAVHLAAGMIAAGYPSVIATMWSIQDKDAPLVAEKVYAQLFEGGVPDIRKASRALHDAVSCLRTKVGEKEFASWVPYIHIGV